MGSAAGQAAWLSVKGMSSRWGRLSVPSGRVTYVGFKWIEYKTGKINIESVNLHLLRISSKTGQ